MAWRYVLPGGSKLLKKALRNFFLSLQIKVYLIKIKYGHFTFEATVHAKNYLKWYKKPKAKNCWAMKLSKLDR